MTWRARRSRQRMALLIASACTVAACAGGDELDAEPVITREVAPSTTAAAEVLVGATTVPDATTTTTEPAPPFEFELRWEEREGRRDRGWLTVPLDYADPGGDTIDLYVVRHRAEGADRVGVLMSNNGGPGAAASTIAENATAWFPPLLTDRFDVVSWDPRGTGRTEGAIDCLDDDEYDEFFGERDITPDDDEEREELVELAEEFAAQCRERVGRPIDFVGTNNTARDMDAIRQALGEPQVTYFGFSYGSELGGVWATMFPDTVRAAVFDGASDPAADPLEATRQQWVGFEAALERFLADCSARSDCAFHNDGDAAAAYDELMATLDERPAFTTPGRTQATLSVAVTGIAQAMYSDAFWPALEQALADAQDGDGDGLLALYDRYYQRDASGRYSNLLEAFEVINCADAAERQTIDEADADAATLVGVAPRLFPYTTGAYTCTFFPAAVDPRIDVTGAGAGPIVVIGTTGDPSTPLATSEAMADALEEGVLVTVEANRHTGYGVNDCVDEVVHDYLLFLTPPEPGTYCA